MEKEKYKWYEFIKKLFTVKTGIIFLILFYALFLMYVCFFKYYNFLYSELDLAIFNQTLFNTVYGNYFYSSIQTQNFFAYHFAPILFLIMPFYYIFPSAVFLIILQLFAVLSGLMPLSLTVKKVFKKDIYILLFCFLYLGNFSLQLITIFEFHILPFAIPLLLYLFYFYYQKNFRWYIFFIILSLLVREDVSFIILGFSFLPLIEKRKIKWFAAPFIMSIIYLFSSMYIIQLINIDNTYQYLAYFSWLGGSVFEIIKNILIHPIQIFLHIFRYPNFEFVLGMLLPFLGLPLLRIKYLVPFVFTYLIFLLTSLGCVFLVLITHYYSVFFPFVLISSIFGLKLLFTQKKQYKDIIIISLLIATFYSGLYYGPFISMIKFKQAKNITEIYKYINSIPKNSPVICTSDYLTVLSGREYIYPLFYIVRGTKQFSSYKYEINSEIDFALINYDYMRVFDFQAQTGTSVSENYDTADDRVRSVIKEKKLGIRDINNLVVFYEKNYESDIKLYEILDEKDFNNKKQAKSFDDKITLLSYNIKDFKQNNSLQKFEFYWRAEGSFTDNFYIKLQYTENNELKDLYLPIAYGIYPVNEWKPGQVVKTNYYLDIPKDSQVKLFLTVPKGFLTVNKLTTTDSVVTGENILGEINL